MMLGLLDFKFIYPSFKRSSNSPIVLKGCPLQKSDRTSFILSSCSMSSLSPFKKFLLLDCVSYIFLLSYFPNFSLFLFSSFQTFFFRCTLKCTNSLSMTFVNDHAWLPQHRRDYEIINYIIQLHSTKTGSTKRHIFLHMEISIKHVLNF